jgi:hypothetical protein
MSALFGWNISFKASRPYFTAKLFKNELEFWKRPSPRNEREVIFVTDCTPLRRRVTHSASRCNLGLPVRGRPGAGLLHNAATLSELVHLPWDDFICSPQTENLDFALDSWTCSNTGHPSRDKATTLSCLRVLRSSKGEQMTWIAGSNPAWEYRCMTTVYVQPCLGKLSHAIQRSAAKVLQETDYKDWKFY